MSQPKIAVIGAGPAGLTAAWELQANGLTADIFESDIQVGGISKTVLRDDWRFDLGGHRFFTKVSKVNELWSEMLPSKEFLDRPRKSRIFYGGKFYDYPLKPLNALFNLGFFETFRCIASLAITKIRPPKDQTNFEGWVAARFGWRLYGIFFKTYTEKVWGLPATSIQSDWAAQRIKNLSLISAIKDAFKIGKSEEVITSLISTFKYPRLGPGQLWESASKILDDNGSKTQLHKNVTSAKKLSNGYEIGISGEYSIYDTIFSTMPLSLIPQLLGAPEDVIGAAQKIKYRDFLIVALPVSNENIFDDNWIYIHDSSVRVGRIQNYGSWSPEMVKPGFTCLGLEYFVNENDDLWSSSDSDLISFGKSELAKIGFTVTTIQNTGYVVRVPKAYPVYDENYQESVNIIRRWLTAEHPNWYQLGRNGQHRYNNQDHSMMTAVEAVNSFQNNLGDYYWDVNVDDEYHEEKNTNKGTGRLAPTFKK